MNKQINEVFNTTDLRRKIFNIKTNNIKNNRKVLFNKVLQEYKPYCDKTKPRYTQNYNFILDKICTKKRNNMLLKWSQEKQDLWWAKKFFIKNMVRKYFVSEQNMVAKKDIFYFWYNLFNGEQDDDNFHIVEFS